MALHRTPSAGLRLTQGTVKEVLLKQAMTYYEMGKSVVIDYVILGEAYIKRYKTSTTPINATNHGM